MNISSVCTVTLRRPSSGGQSPARQQDTADPAGPVLIALVTQAADWLSGCNHACGLFFFFFLGGALSFNI